MVGQFSTGKPMCSDGCHFKVFICPVGREIPLSVTSQGEIWETIMSLAFFFSMCKQHFVITNVMLRLCINIICLKYLYSFILL